MQALDHATGYLAAAGILDALAARHRGAGAARVDVALARTATALLDRAVGTSPAGASAELDSVASTDSVAPAGSEPVDAAPYLVELSHPRGRLRVAAPPGTLDGVPLRWPRV